MSSSTHNALAVRRVRFWQHGRAVRQMLRAYPPGTDALVDQVREAGPLLRFVLLRLLLPLYFAREQGWVVRGERGAMAAIMYLRRNQRHGVRVMHIDDINVDARYRGRGFARRLMALAEEQAIKEQRPFLKLAVTVANTPAVTLYRSLGYEEQHHHFFTTTSATAPLQPMQSSDIQLRRLRRKRATKAFKRFYEMESQASVPQVADLLVTYYSRGIGNTGVPKAGDRRYAIEQRGQQIGYADVYRRKERWNLRLTLHPDVWATESERQVIQRLLAMVGDAQQSAVALHVSSAAHFAALSAGADSLANQLGLEAQSYDRMIMVKLTPRS